MVMNLKNALKTVDYFLLDMDGTLYIGDKLIGDMEATLAFLRKKGKKLIYLTNNSSKNVEEYVEKLKRIGLFGEGDEVYSSGVAAAEFLISERKGKSVYLLGTKALKAEYESKGVPVTEDKPDICLLSYDTELEYGKLCKFTNYLQAGAEYIATHPDDTCPAPEYFVPDIGSFIAMIKVATGRTPDKIIGKPYTGMGETLMKRFSAKPENFMMVGDRLHTDIKFGNNCGFFTTLVLSGESKVADINENTGKPDFILEDFNKIVDEYG